MNIAVILFAFNRPRYLKRVIKTHSNVEGLDYYAFVDYSDKRGEVIDIIHKSQLYHTIYLRESHYGCNKNIVLGISKIFGLGYDAVIVLEDDLVIDKDGIEYLKDRLIKSNKNCLSSVSLFKGSYASIQFHCWGWGTWKEKWEGFNLNEGLSWDIQLDNYFQSKGWLCSCSSVSRVKHIGVNGTHYKWWKGK